jgi:hypothetical protein
VTVAKLEEMDQMTDRVGEEETATTRMDRERLQDKVVTLHWEEL